jgi:DNA-binding CsgD family transcriptional regulator
MRPHVATPLSEREHEVLRQLAEGASNKELARALDITTATIKRHLANIFLKLGVCSRTQAVARARSAGLLETLEGVAEPDRAPIWSRRPGAMYAVAQPSRSDAPERDGCAT